MKFNLNKILLGNGYDGIVVLLILIKITQLINLNEVKKLIKLD